MKENIYIPSPRSHLDLKIPGVKPIFASVMGRQDAFDDEETTLELIEEREAVYEKIRNKSAVNVDYHGMPLELKRRNFLNGGYQTYTLSPVDKRDKASEGLFDCTGIIVTGIEKETGENISFATHQDPKKILTKELSDKFTTDLEKQMREIKSRCLAGSIDAVIVGGMYRKYEEGHKKTVAGAKDIPTYQENYINSINLLSQKTKEFFGFEPTVVNGPKTHNPDHYYYDTKNRRLYLIKPYINPSAGDFPPSEAEKAKGDWISGNFIEF